MVFNCLLSSHSCVVFSFLYILHPPNFPASSATCSPENAMWHLPFILLCSAVSWKTNIKWQLQSTLSLAFTLMLPFANLGENSEFRWETLLIEDIAPIFWPLEETWRTYLYNRREFQKQNYESTHSPRGKKEYYYAYSIIVVFIKLVFELPGAQARELTKLASLLSPKRL